jgi:ureidoglycolate amidohydrolase
MAGLLDEARLDKLVDSSGNTYNQVRKGAGFLEAITTAVLPRGYFHAWIELHIEQGPALEASQLPIGIVTAIAAPATMVVEITGQGGHAGAVLMPIRKDALCAAAEMISEIERLARKCPSDDLVATVGELKVHPGAVNSIPSHVRFTIDLRDINGNTRDEVKSEIESAISSIANRRGVGVTVQTLNADPPASASAMIIDAAKSACHDSGLAYQTMISRAYHDSLFIAQIAPMSMLFIPCRGGVSHRPDEYSSPEEITRGIEVLARTLASLSAG